ncbi:MAG: DSD1 family PLP-dependent enzyme [Alphaproteobacteria bacterium]|nr:DSD1 family PLP-dependent enzyme [Alphaproteobacteria bacterium]
MPPSHAYLNESLIGQAAGRHALATPALVVDLRAFERNVTAMQEHCHRVGLKLRPHAKTHKSVTIARKQLAAGAVGVCCAKLGEAEVLAEGGIEGLLVTSPVVVAQGFARIAKLNAKLNDFMIVADSAVCVDGYSGAARESGKRLKVLVDVDIGLHRTGIAPGARALELAKRIVASADLQFMGLQGYAGQLQHVPEFPDRRTQSLAALKLLGDTRDLIVANGIACPIVSGGGTGTYNIDAEARVFTELQAGSYVFMDKQYCEVKIANAAPLPFESALFVQSTVISANMPGLVTTDAGLKSFATEAGAPVLHSGAPDGANYFFFGDEQGGIMLGGADKHLPLGSTVCCTAPHCDPTVNLYDVYHVVDSDRLVEIWPIEGRGRSA